MIGVQRLSIWDVRICRRRRRKKKIGLKTHNWNSNGALIWWVTCNCNYRVAEQRHSVIVNRTFILLYLL